MNEMKVKVEGGHLVATKGEDAQYPGLGIEFIPDNDGEDNSLSTASFVRETQRRAVGGNDTG